MIIGIRQRRRIRYALGEGAIVTASIGTGLAPGISAAALMAAADAALYEAKNAGRDRVSTVVAGLEADEEEIRAVA